LIMTQRIQPLKRYSQNFLTNRYYAEKIIAALNLKSDDVVLEIGAGTGMLTEIIQKYACTKIVSLEVDRRCIPLLQEKLSAKVEIVQDSILNFSIEDLYLTWGKKVKVVGNIPYHITSEILFRLMDDRGYISQVVLMVQKEVADRLLATPHNKVYGIPTVLLGYYAQINRLFNLSRKNFLPVPKVDSTVITLSFREERNELRDHDLFIKLVRQCFQTRRKMIQNGLKRIFNPLLVERIKTIPLSVRPEDLTIEDYVNLANEIYYLSSLDPQV